MRINKGPTKHLVNKVRRRKIIKIKTKLPKDTIILN